MDLTTNLMISQSILAICFLFVSIIMGFGFDENDKNI
jgi:hypothetical protein